MSIVERALDRMQRGAARPQQPEAPANVRIAALSPQGVEDAVDSGGRRLLIDRAAVRSLGYLPESSEDRRFADQYRQIKRTLISNFLASAVQGPGSPGLIMMASALPGDGKTFTSINLALSIARERDVSVVLVDADVAKPHISQIFGVEGEPGLLNALADETIDIESLVWRTDVRGLSVLPAGPHNSAATEMISSARMQQLVTQLQQRNPRRIVLFDSSPLLATSESLALADIAGHVALVVRSGKTPREAVLEAIEKLGEGRNVSLVLNQGRPSITQNYYYGQGSYGDPPPT